MIKILLLSINTLCGYTDATPSSRNMIECERIIKSGFIIVCGMTCKFSNRIDAFLLSLRTSGLASEPRTITGKLLIMSNPLISWIALAKLAGVTAIGTLLLHCCIVIGT